MVSASPVGGNGRIDGSQGNRRRQQTDQDQGRVFDADRQAGEQPGEDRGLRARPFVKPDPGEDGGRAEGGQRDIVERSRHAVGDGRHGQRDRAGPPGAAAQAGTGQRGHIGGEHDAQDPLDTPARDRPAKLERDRVEHLGHERIDGLMEVGHKADRSVHQEHLGHLEVIAESVAVGDRRQRGDRRARPARAPDRTRRKETVTSGSACELAS